MYILFRLDLMSMGRGQGRQREESKLQASRTNQWVKTLAFRSENPSSILGIRVMEGD